MRSILIHLNGSPADLAAVNAGWSVGPAFAAHLDGPARRSYARRARSRHIRVDGDSRGALDALEQERLAASKATFEPAVMLIAAAS